MKKAFIRGIWGDFTGPKVSVDLEGNMNGFTTPRPNKMIKDVLMQVRSNPNIQHHDFVVYTMGKYNHDYLKTLGFNSVLMDERSVIWDMKTELYRHKLEVIKRAMEDYDEIVYLDWDCYLTKQMPDNVWDILSEGESCQANLFQYRTKHCLWRKKDLRKTCNGGFIYVADKSIPDKFIENWDSLRAWALDMQKQRRDRGLELRFREKCLMFDDEPAISKYIDDYCGGWPGVEVYWQKFEPKICNLRKKSAFTEEENNSKDACFMHML